MERGIKKPLLFFHPAYKEPIKFRPLGDLEIHECFNKPLNSFMDEITLLAYMELRNSGKISFLKFNPLKLDKKKLADAMDEMMTWIIYMSTKDFQDDDYSLEDVKKLKGISDLGHLIMHVSGNTQKSTELLKKFIKEPKAQSLIYLINIRGYKIGELEKLTKLQREFLVRIDPTKMAAQHKYDLESQAPGTIDFTNNESAVQQFRNMFKGLTGHEPKHPKHWIRDRTKQLSD